MMEGKGKKFSINHFLVQFLFLAVCELGNYRRHFSIAAEENAN
jgi:hypothetical protein